MATYVWLLLFGVVLMAAEGDSKSFVKLDLNKRVGSKARSERFQRGASLRVDLRHREAEGSPIRAREGSERLRLLGMLRRDSRRVSGIAQRLKPRHSPRPALAQEGFESPLRSGLVDGSGEYFVTLGIGTPASTLHLIADTGSDVSWIQCLPCQLCYTQNDPFYNSSLSSTFSPLPCSAPLCGQLDARGCSNNKCVYGVAYGDNSSTVGLFATETLTFGVTPVPNFAIGCGVRNEGLFAGAAGLFGLGQGKLSFPSQIGPSYGNVFSYCLPSIDSANTASLIFGSGAVPSDSEFTPLLTNPELDSFYYVKVTGIRIGGDLVTLPSNALLLDSSGNGGVILDSGTTITRLASSVYDPVRSAFRSLAQDLTPTSGFSILDTCFDLSGLSSVDIPTVAFEFDGGAIMDLPANNILLSVDNKGTFCFAFAPNSDGFSIIGNVQQQTFRMSFNSLTSQVGIAADQCE